MRSLLYLVHLPPPVHGVAQVNRLVVGDRTLNETLRTSVLELRSSNDLAELDRLSVRKVVATVRLYFDLVARCMSFRPEFAYLSPVPTGPAFLRDLISICILRLFRVRRILHLHGLGIREKRHGVWPALYRVAFSDAAVISISAAQQALELEWLDLRSARMYVVRNAVDDLGTRARQDERRAVRLLFLSATFRSKGVFVLLEAFERLAARYSGVDLEIVGSSEPAVDDEIGAWISERGLGARVTQPGSLYGEQKWAAFARADVFVHPTLRDYFPLVVLEAMSAGLPVVSTRVGAIPEIVEEGKTGLLCPPGDAIALADTLERLVTNPDLRHGMGGAARRRFEENFSIESFRRELAAVFRAEGALA